MRALRLAGNGPQVNARTLSGTFDTRVGLQIFHDFSLLSSVPVAR